MRALSAALLLVLAGCAAAPAQSTLDAHNQRSYDQAVARAQRKFGGAPFTPSLVSLWNDAMYGYQPPPAEGEEAPPQPQPLTQSVRGQGQGDQLYRMPSGTLGMAGPTCASGDACGCDAGIGYVYLQRDDGHVAVVRLQPKIVTYTVEVDACGYGCGQPAPPAPTIIADLGVTDPALIEVLEQTVRTERRVEHCDHPMPRP